MIRAEELRIGNLVSWNPKLLNPTVTLPPMQIEVFSIMQDKISYVFPNIENRVEPFEDDVVKMGNDDKVLQELEPITLTIDIVEETGFTEKGGLLASKYFEKGDLQLKYTGEYFQRVSVTKLNTTVYDWPIKHFHQLQNLYFALTGEELEIKLHGQQA
ncbi:MAG: hypothetical protein JWQ09_1475 [Segetibacter sp.]|nr:hypothetical protein [Segetibacter sp.]